MKTRSWFIFRVMVVVCSVAAFGAVVLILSAQSKEEVSKTVWNDPTMLTGPDGRPRWEKYAPSVDDADQAFVIASPPAAEVESCMGWMRRVVNPGVLPAELRSHLLALKRWPKYGGEDVFVTWYVTGGRLIYVVAGNADLTVFTVPLAEEPAETTLDDHVALAVRVAESVLTSEMLPHPESGVHRHTRSTVPGVTAGSWLPAALDLSRDAEGRLTMVTPSSPTSSVVWFLTDGEFVRLQVIKAYPGPRAFGDRSRARFEPADETEEASPRSTTPPPSGDEPIEFHGGELTPEELENEAN